MTIIVTLYVEATPGKREELIKALRPLLGPTRVESGCLSCQLYSETEHPNTLMLMEVWKSKEQLARHICSEDYIKVLSWLELSATPPVVRLHTVAQTQGLEVIESLRTSGKTNQEKH